jgi:cyclopropane-fatty-acyl-phospholipid synthase
MSVKQKVVSRLSPGAVRSLIKKAGLIVDGPNPWDPQVKDRAFFETVVRDGILGLGDSYVSGMWNCDDLFGFFSRILSAGLLEQMAEAGPMVSLVQRFAGTNSQTPEERVRDNITQQHYDLSGFFEAFLGSSMAYTCTRWEGPSNIDTDDVTEGLDCAQWGNHENICDKLSISAAALS